MTDLQIRTARQSDIEQDYLRALDNDWGWCTECNEWTREDHTEPDAQDYPCPHCDRNTVIGADMFLMEYA